MNLKPLHLAIAAGAVVLLMGGTATAGALVTSAQIKDGTVTTKDVKDRSLTAADLVPGTLQAGPQGPQGPAGAQGPQGPKGDPATSTPVPALRAEGVKTTCEPGSQAISNTGAGVQLRWTRKVFDNANMLSSDCAKAGDLVAARSGVYLVTASIEWPGVADTESRTLGIRMPGSPYLAADRRANVPGEPTQQSISTLVSLPSGGKVQVWAFQHSPAGLPIDPSLSTSTVTMSLVSPS